MMAHKRRYLVFQPVYRYFKRIGKSSHISAWKSNGLTDEIIIATAASYNSLAPVLSYTPNQSKSKI